MGVIKFLGKIIAIPIIPVLVMIHLLLALVIYLGSRVLAIFINILIICAIVAIINAQWVSLGILIVLALIGLVLLFGAATIQMIVDDTKENLLVFVKS